MNGARVGGTVGLGLYLKLMGVSSSKNCMLLCLLLLTSFFSVGDEAAVSVVVAFESVEGLGWFIFASWFLVSGGGFLVGFLCAKSAVDEW